MPKVTSKTNKNKKSIGLKNRLIPAKRSNKLLALIFILASVVVGIIIIVRAFASTAQGTYSWWFWNAPKSGFYSMENNITIQANDDPTARYFWSHEFYFINGGETGYMGLQANGSRAIDKSVGKTAVFSIFGTAINATAGNCKLSRDGFDGYVGESGSSCIIAYDWVIGRAYKFKTAITGADSAGVWWTGTVTDTVTGVQTVIGRIQAPASWQGLIGQTVMWAENFYDTASTCQTVPYAKVLFGTPVANGNMWPTSSSNNLSNSSTCQGNSGSKITKVSSGVIQETGVPAVTPKSQPVAGFLTAAYPFAQCEQKVNKSDGSVDCAIDSTHPKFTLGNVSYTYGAYKQFCFKGVRAAGTTGSIRVTVGNIYTGLSRSVNKSITDGKVFDDACVSVDSIFSNGANYNYAMATSTSGTTLMYGGFPK